MPTIHRPLLIAHRGATADAPENTLAAFALGWEQQADGMETDLHLTRDGQIVCIHDETTARTSNRDLRVAECTLEELRAIDAGSWKHPRYAGQRIPTFDEALAQLPQGKSFFIEIKCGPEVLPVLQRKLEGYPWPEQLLIMSFDEPVVEAAARRFPHLPAAWLLRSRKDEATGRRLPVCSDVPARAAAMGVHQVSVPGLADYVDDAYVAALQQANLRVHVWTIDKEADAMRFAALGVDTLITNRPGPLRQAFQTHASCLTKGRIQRPAI